jgi:thiamine kinase-like enzyme
MDDGSLCPPPDESQGPEGELGRIVQQLEPRLGAMDAAPSPLEGGITNRNFRVSLGGYEYVIRIPGKDTSLLEIDRTAECEANELAAKLGVGPAVAALLDEPQSLVTEFVQGDGMEPADLRRPEAVAVIASALNSLHGSGAELPTDFNSFRIVETYARTAAERGVEVPPAYEEVLGQAQRIEAALSGPEHEPVPCHNDLLAANFIRDGQQIWIVDWEYAGMGNRYFDLANFAINNEVEEADFDSLLDAYFGDGRPADSLACLRLFMLMSDFREAMWGVVQSGVSELDFDFDGYASKHFDRMLETAANPAFERWLEEAGDAGG